MQIRFPDSIHILSEAQTFRFTGTTEAVQDDIRVSLSKKEETLNVSLTADTTPVSFIRLYWHFSDAEKRPIPYKIYGDAWERTYGDAEWRGLCAHRCMPWVCAVSNGSDLNTDYQGRFTDCFGVKVRPSALCFWQYDGKGVLLWLDVRSGGLGVLLNGRTLDLCDILFETYTDTSAFKALRVFYFRLCDDPILPDHKVYGNNNWYYAYGNSSYEEILQDTDILMQGCKGLKNPPYMVVDDCWSKNRCDAPWDTLCDTFSDMKKLAEEISAKGARPGIWFRPLSDQTNVLPLQKMQNDNRFLDPSHPEVLAYVAKTVRMLCHEWGYKLIKHDFSTFDMFGAWGFQRPTVLAEGDWHFYNRHKTSAEIVLDLYKTISDAAGRDVLLLGCNVIGHLAAGTHQLNRIGDDTSGRTWDRTRKFGVNTLAFRMLHHKAFYDADADCIGITNAIDWRMNKKWLSILANSGTSLFVSPKPSDLTDQIRADLKEAYAVNSVQADTLEPLDWMENTCPEHWLLNGKEIA